MRQLHNVPNLLFVSKNTTLRKYPNSMQLFVTFWEEIFKNMFQFWRENTKQSSKQDYVNIEFVDSN